MTKYLLTFVLFLVPLQIFALNEDSLYNVLKIAKEQERISIADKLVAKQLILHNESGAEKRLQAEKSIALKLKDNQLVARVLYREAQVLVSLLNYKAALKGLVRAAQIDDSMHLKSDLVGDYEGLGSILRIQKNYSQAFKYFQSGLQLARTISDSFRMNQCYFEIGQLYGIEEELDSAQKYMMLSLDMSKRTGNLSFANHASEELADNYMARKMFDKAIATFLSVAEYDKKIDNMDDIFQVYSNLAECYIQKKDPKLAEKYGLLSLDIALKNNFRDGLAMTYSILSDVYKDKGDYKQALIYSDRSRDLQDSISEQNSSKQMAELDTKYETSKKEKEIESQKAELGRRGLIVYASLGFALLILIGGGIVFFNYQKIRALGHKLEEQKQSLEELNGLKDKLFSIISHDLRGPLTNTIAMLDLLAQDQFGEDQLKSFSKTLSESLQHNLQLLDNLLNWAGSQIKGVKVIKKEWSLQGLIDENVEAIKSAATRKNITLQENGIADTNVYADISIARIVLRNLLSNALKYTPEGGCVTVEGTLADGMAKVSVTDTGIGMDDSLKSILFTHQMTESRPGTGREKGFGIGLKLSKEFIEKNGGNIYVESVQGEGSTFSFTLPVAATA